ncbi:MAG: hypothetical protein KDC87_04255 [Planctomycetes bacterium]|nr:hypothetical protein [Planctomycetota bacterium]MCB9870192.1 hypothetical protein [Planctomycetota bacterium]MCB9888228.1 hypothetical protein [Planctomycetota bacterium]
MADARPVWPTVLVLLLPVLVFAPALGNGFALDGAALASAEWVANPGRPDPVIAELHGPGFYFGKFYWYAEGPNDGLYRPVAIYSYALLHWLAGSWDAFAQHAANLLLHLLATWLVLRLLRAIGAGWIAAHAGAAVFGVHAIHSEVVAGIVGRSELLPFVFGLGAAGTFVRAEAARGGARLWFQILAGAQLFGAVAAKESGLTFAPFLVCVLLARRWAAGPGGVPLFPQLLRAAAVCAVGVTPYLFLRHRVMVEFDAPYLVDYAANPLYGADAVTRLATAVKLWGYGLWQCIAPFWLSATYGAEVFQLAHGFADAGVIAAAVALAGSLFIGLRFARRQPPLFLAMASLLGLSFVTSNVPFAIGAIYAERFYYAPSLGACILVAWLVDRVPRPRIALTGIAVWMVACAAVILLRNGVWRDTATLFTHEARQQPRAANFQVQVAQLLREVPQRHGEAFAQIDKALALIPEYPHALREKASLHARRKEWPQAIEAFERAFRSPYVELPEAKALCLVRIAKVWRIERQPRRAVEYALRGLEIAPQDKDAWKIVAEFGADVLPPDRANKLFVQAVEAARTDPVLAVYLGVMGEKVGADPRTVVDVLNYAVQATPADQRPPGWFVEAVFALGNAHRRAGDPGSARVLFQQMLANPTLPQTLRDRVTAALAALGR